VNPLPGRVRLVAAPGALRDVELEVFGWRTEHGETMVRCRLVDGSVGTIPARWTDLPVVGSEPEPLGVMISPAGWRCLRERVEVLRSRRPRRVEPLPKTEVVMSGQLALGLSEVLVAAAVWEALPPERQREITVQLARLLARLVEAERDE
jgi:hypothetical protein